VVVQGFRVRVRGRVREEDYGRPREKKEEKVL